jgi:hypothetical protein
MVLAVRSHWTSDRAGSTHAGSDSPQELSVAAIRRLIEEAGRIPIERDTLYHEVIRTEDRWQTGRSLQLVMALTA